MIREQLLGSFADRLQVLEGFMDGEVTVALRQRCEHCGRKPTRLPKRAEVVKVAVSPADRLRAFDLAAKYGLGTVKDVLVESIRERLAQTLVIIRNVAPSDLSAEIINRMKEVWQ